MSTNYKSTPPSTSEDKPISLTQYAGPRMGTMDNRRLQLTRGPDFINVSKGQALDLARDLLAWYAGDLEEE